MTPLDIIKWSDEQQAAGMRDAFGGSFTDWEVARYLPDGRAMRTPDGRQVFETQAAFKARHAAELEALSNCSKPIKCNGAAWGQECPKRNACAHHNTHQLARIDARALTYSLHDAAQGWALLACKDLTQLEAFVPLAPKAQTEQKPQHQEARIGETLDLFA